MVITDPRKDGSYIALQLDALSSAITTTNIGYNLDGSVPFSVDAYVRFNGLSAQTRLLSVVNFSFGSKADTIFFALPNVPIVISDPSQSALKDNTWHHVCASFDGAQVRLFIDGQFNVQQSLAPTGTDQPGPVTLGSGLQGLIRYVRVFNRALTAESVAQNMFGVPDPSSLVTYFDFSQIPPVDIGPRKVPIRLQNNAAPIQVSPALTLAATGYAQPARDEAVNPGGAQVDPYTVQSWIYLNASTNPQQAVFVNADLESDSGMALLLELNQAANAYNLVAVRGSTVDSHRLVSTATVPMNAWVNVATTFDGTTASLYIAGQPAGSVAAGPITVYRPVSQLLIGAALSQGVPTGATSLQGYMRSVDVWRRALSASEIVTYMTAAPPSDDPDIAAVYEFTSAPARNLINGHPVGLADGAVLSGQLGTPASPEPAHVARLPFEALDSAVVAKLAKAVDFAQIFRDGRADFETARDAGLADAPARIRDRLAAAWSDIFDRFERGIPPNGVVTDHVIGDERVLIAHGADGPRVVYRAPVATTPECTMWLVRLFFVALAGIIACTVGVNATLSDRATTFIARLLLRPTMMRLLASGAAITGTGILSLLAEVYTAGALRQLIYLVLDLSVWTLFRILARLVLVACGVGWADFIVQLAITVAAFVAVYRQRPASCDPIPTVSLAAIKFNWDPSNAVADALTIRKDFATPINTPEWIPSKTKPEEAPAAYAIALVTGKTVKIQAKFLISAATTQKVEIQATGGGVLGAIDPVTVTFDSSNVSQPEWVRITLNHHTIVTAGVSRSDITWTWQYRVAGGAWQPMATTNHRIYTVLDRPNGPWQQSASTLDTQRPWTDVLDRACVWASGATTADAAATAVMNYVYSSLGLNYVTGATKYAQTDSTGDWVFLCTDFVDLLNGGAGQGKIVNCTDCATIVTVFANVLGCNNFASRMQPTLTTYNFNCNKIIAIGWTDWDWPFPIGPSGPGNFTYHEVSWTGAGGYPDPLYDACLKLDVGVNPWDWTTPGITHTPALADKMPFSYPPFPVAPPLATPFTEQTYRERLTTNAANGMPKCAPIGARLNSQGGRPKVT